MWKKTEGRKIFMAKDFKQGSCDAVRYSRKYFAERG